MPTQYDMGPDEDLYRAVLEYEVQPMRTEPNQHYDPLYRHTNGVGYDRKKQPWSQTIQVPDGPKETRERMIGPYRDIKPIKAYVTRNRGRYNGDNLRIKEIQKVTAWEAVDYA